MGTVVDKLNYLKETKTAIRNALVEKGVSVADSDTFRSYAQKIAGIPAGGEDISTLIDGTLTEITSDVTSIRDYAFYGCSSITGVTFPLVTSIGAYAFYGCTSLVALYIGIASDTVCTLLDSNAIPSSVTDIYVPETLVDSYKVATNWSVFADKIKAYTDKIA